MGASTGGFTDCLLQQGGARVYALDVGHGQLHHKIRTDKRVAVMEKCNARYPFDLPERVDLVVMDVSFISLSLVVPQAAAHLRDGGLIAALVKPQFEAERGQVGRGGVVRDPKVHAAALGKNGGLGHGAGPSGKEHVRLAHPGGQGKPGVLPAAPEAGPGAGPAA